MRNTSFDIIVLGGGTSGCIAAWYLARSGLNTCVVEAGPDYGHHSEGKWPREILDSRVTPVTTHDWGYRNTNALGNDLNDIHAKVLGGCSAHNHCTAVWPPPDDFESWGIGSNSGWSYEELFPLIDKVERVSPDSATPFRGKNGLLFTKIQQESNQSSWQPLVLESVRNCGYERLSDLSAPSPGEGLGTRHSNITHDGVRWNSSFAFLDPVRHLQNLTIIPDTLIDRLILHGGKAVEVLCRKTNNSVIVLRANKFLLTAGPYGSPMILLRSGIGARKDLATFSISETIELPGVGANLQDHPGLVVQFEPTDVGKELLSMDIKRSIRLIIPSILRAKSKVTDRSYDLHLILQAFKTGKDSFAFGTTVFNVAPRSRGNLGLTGRDPSLPPQVDYRYFTDERNQDAAALKDGIFVSQKIWRTDPSRRLVEKELMPDDCTNDANIQDCIRRYSISYHHPVGTCKMGPQSYRDSVVDYSGLVKGSDNIFVGDTSIIPRIPRVNTNLLALLIGLKVAISAIGSS